jgi:hypothetical protein
MSRHRPLDLPPYWNLYRRSLLDDEDGGGWRTGEWTEDVIAGFGHVIRCFAEVDPAAPGPTIIPGGSCRHGTTRSRSVRCAAKQVLADVAEEND